MKRLFLSVAAVLMAATTLVLASQQAAFACSCAFPDLGTLDQAPAAVIGTVTAVDDVPDRFEDEQAYVATVSVERDLKGNLADEIYLRAYDDDGGNCGVTLRPGSEISALIWEDEEGVLHTDGCSGVPQSLFEDWSPPVGVGGVAEAVAATWGGGYRVVAYDGSGTRIAFGPEQGVVVSMGACEDGLGMVELTDEGEVSLRGFEDFAVVGNAGAVPERPSTFSLESVACNLGSMTVEVIASNNAGELFVHRWEAGEWTEQEMSNLEPAGITLDSNEWWPEIDTLHGGVIQPGDNFNAVMLLEETVTIAAQDGEAVPVRQLGTGAAPGEEPPAVEPPIVETTEPASETPATPEIASPADPSGGGGSSALAIAAIAVGAIAVLATAAWIFLSRNP